MLFFYRKIYSEVVTAIPNNGGCYNALLNTSTKKIASLAACLSILSYTATAIVSAFDAVVYLQILWPGVGMFYFVCCCFHKNSLSILFIIILPIDL